MFRGQLYGMQGDLKPIRCGAGKGKKLGEEETVQHGEEIGCVCWDGLGEKGLESCRQNSEGLRKESSRQFHQSYRR